VGLDGVTISQKRAVWMNFEMALHIVESVVEKTSKQKTACQIT
jgi:hypothetical protein